MSVLVISCFVNLKTKDEKTKSDDVCVMVARLVARPLILIVYNSCRVAVLT